MTYVTSRYNAQTNNIKVINYYAIDSKNEIIKFLAGAHLEFIDRSIMSCLNEWIAHRRLYKLGLFKKHTKDCDLSADESYFRRVCYWILSRFYWR